MRQAFLESPDATIRNQGAAEVESSQRLQIRELFDAGVRDLCLAEVEPRQQLKILESLRPASVIGDWLRTRVPSS